MKYAILTTLSLASLLVFSESAFASGTSSPWVEEAIMLMNSERSSRGISELVVNEELADAAGAKLRDMEKKNYFAHTSPENLTPWSFIEESGYRYRFAGENLAIHFKDPRSEHDAWMKSEKHCQNILDPRFQEVGIAVGKVFFEGRETMLAVSMFGTKSGSETALEESKDMALSMCHGLSGAEISEKLSQGDDTGRLALFLKSIRNGSYDFAEIFAITMFAFAQISSIMLVFDLVLSRERREGLFIS